MHALSLGRLWANVDLFIGAYLLQIGVTFNGRWVDYAASESQDLEQHEYCAKR